MCLFCTMKRRQVFRGLAAVAVGGVAQAVGIGRHAVAPLSRRRLRHAGGCRPCDRPGRSRRRGDPRTGRPPLSGGRELGRAAARLQRTATPRPSASTVRITSTFSRAALIPSSSMIGTENSCAPGARISASPMPTAPRWVPTTCSISPTILDTRCASARRTGR